MVLGIQTVSVFGFSLAGVQVIMHGRIYVFTEGRSDARSPVEEIGRSGVRAAVRLWLAAGSAIRKGQTAATQILESESHSPASCGRVQRLRLAQLPF